MVTNIVRIGFVVLVAISRVLIDGERLMISTERDQLISGVNIMRHSVRP